MVPLAECRHTVKRCMRCRVLQGDSWTDGDDATLLRVLVSNYSWTVLDQTIDRIDQHLSRPLNPLSTSTSAVFRILTWTLDTNTR